MDYRMTLQELINALQEIAKYQSPHTLTDIQNVGVDKNANPRVVRTNRGDHVGLVRAQ